MPTPRPCSVHRCPQFAAPGRAYCTQHLAQRWQLGLTGETRKAPNWRKLRRQVFARQHQRCATPGCANRCTVLHHLRSAYENAPTDLVGLCEPCHRQLHASPSRTLRA